MEGDFSVPPFAKEQGILREQGSFILEHQQYIHDANSPSFFGRVARAAWSLPTVCSVIQQPVSYVCFCLVETLEMTTNTSVTYRTDAHHEAHLHQ